MVGLAATTTAFEPKASTATRDMPIYELLQDKIKAIAPTSFGAAGVKERGDLQRLLRTQIEVLAPDGQFTAEDSPYLKHLCDSGVSPEQIAAAIPWRRLFWRAEGTFNPEEFLLKAG